MLYSSYPSAADSHPIHIHQIKFDVVKRCDRKGDDITNPDNLPDTCIEGFGVLGYMTGWKDAVIAYPNVDDAGDPRVYVGTDIPIGSVTTVRMKFDIPGVYGQLFSAIISHYLYCI
mmetsp:Transcript_27204/g.58285  ORF Transcript_27204/g.58285 Transcript_27204/m.58285 type:complete len:116 (-) Transcript_27204:1090-1437(-)|eukprot:CAMPEP_0172300082 /NCGR_PEP_ID=MMETSP1058-20130122/2267_1 /TAXON_ID=83371 /ORGANISM="Detonula confervacea, Strain CCMP 353" /LENGTH=115 /DNA_ID=CAMNT_0013009767 /DNA_START=116 /DNA_END=463 /DNA_ORIENTATION=-